MDYRSLDTTVKKQFKTNWLKLSLLLFACSILAFVLGIVPSILLVLYQNDSFFLVLGILVIILMPTIQNTLYALFLKTIRKERFGKADIKYSFGKIGYHVGIYLVLYFLQMGLSAIVNMIFSGIPGVYSVISTLLNILMLCVGVFCAFAIFDGVKGVFAIINGSIKIIMKEWKNVVLFALPFVIWTFLLQLGYNYVLASLLDIDTTSLDNMVQAMLNNPNIASMLMYEILFYLVQYLGSAVIQVYMFLAYGYLYEDAYTTMYPHSTKANLRGKVIDIDESY